MAREYQIPETMEAVRVTEYNKPYSHVKDCPVPRPDTLGPEDLLLQIAVAGYCHTDSLVVGGHLGSPLPMTASHEGVGIVAAVGSSVLPEKFKVGDRVMAGIMIHPCGTCIECTGPMENRNYCEHVDGNIGLQINGAFAEYLLNDTSNTTKLPNEMSFQTAAALACAGRTAWGIVNRAVDAIAELVALDGVAKGTVADTKRARALAAAEADIRGRTLAIIGAGGGVGHLTIQFAKARGLRVVGLDARDEGLEISKDLGCDLVLDARGEKDEVVKKVREFAGGWGVDAATTLADEGTPLACAVTRTHGIVIQAAAVDPVPVPLMDHIFRDIQIRGTLNCSASESEKMVAAFVEHRMKALVEVFDGLDKVKDVVERAHSGRLRGKAVVVVNRDLM
jgi:alcohol dehydrogenase, propanol-preferring